MGLKTTLFAVLLVFVITWRNRAIADLDGKEYLPYGLADVKRYAPDAFNKMKRMFKRKK